MHSISKILRDNIAFAIYIDSRKTTVITSKRGCIKETVSGFVLIQPLVLCWLNELRVKKSGLCNLVSDR